MAAGVRSTTRTPVSWRAASFFTCARAEVASKTTDTPANSGMASSPSTPSEVAATDDLPDPRYAGVVPVGGTTPSGKVWRRSRCGLTARWVTAPQSTVLKELQRGRAAMAPGTGPALDVVGVSVTYG